MIIIWQLLDFFNSQTISNYLLDGLHAKLILLDDNCKNYNEIYKQCSSILLASKGENLVLCKESLHQLIGDIAMFLEGVETNVKIGM